MIRIKYQLPFIEHFFICSSENALQKSSASSSLFHRRKKTPDVPRELLAQGQKAKQGNCFPCQAKPKSFVAAFHCLFCALVCH